MTAVEVEHVGICYRRGLLSWDRVYWAVTDVSFSVNHGEVLGVLGRNGAGKSTLLRAIAGIIAPDRGRIRLDGNSVALLAGQTGFRQELTGRQNVMLSGLVLGMTRAEVLAKLDSILDFAELGEFIDEQVWTYSIGMRARLGFAIALNAESAILLIDETLGVGDREFKDKAKGAIRQKIRSLDHTTILVTHDMKLAEELCDQVVVIEDGKVLLAGTPTEVLAQWRPRHGMLCRPPPPPS